MTEGTPYIRRATAADAWTIAAFVPGLVPSATQDHRATFLVDGPQGVIAVMDVVQEPERLVIEHLVARDSDGARMLVDYAEKAGLALGAKELVLKDGATTAEIAAANGFGDGVRKLGLYDFSSLSVPLWRNGKEAFSTALYYRGVWAALALLVGLGSVSVAVFSAGEVRLIHIVAPSVICTLGTLFAFWQVFLIVKAAQRSGERVLFGVAIVVALSVAGSVLGLIGDRAVPSLTELWAIYNGDKELDDLTVSVSADGRTLSVNGAYSLYSDDAVRKALNENRNVTDVVLTGPGGRIGVGYALFRLFRDRKLNTHVVTACASACTIAFLGGVERTITSTGRLGFHRASFPGMNDNDMYEANRDMRQFLIYSARVTPAFAQKVVDTPGDGIWVPTPQELLAGKVVTKIVER